MSLNARVRLVLSQLAQRVERERRLLHQLHLGHFTRNLLIYIAQGLSQDGIKMAQTVRDFIHGYQDLMDNKS
ncbi:hypothetical protein B566_EDAN015112, partial [Ephemera danica]